MKMKGMAENKADIHLFEIDLPALEAKARASESREAYHQVSSGNDYRLGVIVAVSPNDALVFSVELLVSVFSGWDKFQITNMERVVRLSKKLRGREYSVSHGDDGWLLYERTLPRDGVAGECKIIISLLSEFKANNRELDDTKEKDDCV